MKRCINIDWLEVYCKQQVPITPELLRQDGWHVEERQYGTPQYAQMFTIYNDKSLNFPLYEVRREPYSIKENGGIFDKNDCHIRLSNYECYRPKCVERLQEFFLKYGIIPQSISRIDICLDTLTCDDGKDMGEFIREYIMEQYYKVHISRIAPHGPEVNGSFFNAHGKEAMYKREYNSIKWGAPTSVISVKIYNKTQEMAEVKSKPYILQQWMAAGLYSDKDVNDSAHLQDVRYNIAKLTKAIKFAKNKEEIQAKLSELKQKAVVLKEQLKKVWRIEFSIKSSIKGFARTIEADQDSEKEVMYSLNLANIQKQSHLLFTFMTLAKRYLQFKKVEMTKNGTPKRKDRCKDYFPVGEADIPVYKPIMPTINKDVARGTKMIINYLQMIADSTDDAEMPYNVRQAMGATIMWLGYYYRLKQVENKGQSLMNWREVLFKQQNQILTSLSTVIELNDKINQYEQKKISEDNLKEYINTLYDKSFNVLQDEAI